MKVVSFFIFISISIAVKCQTPDTAAIRVEIDSLIQFNRQLIKEQKLDEALHIIKQAKEICLSAFGEESEPFALVLYNLGKTYYYQGNFLLAESNHSRSKDIRERILGKLHDDYIKSVSRLARVSYDLDNKMEAEQYLLESLSLKEKTTYIDDSEIYKDIELLARLYKEMELLEKARPFLDRLEVDSLVQNNIELNKKKKYKEALEPILRAEEKCRSAFGEYSPLFAWVMYHKGKTYNYQLDLENAEIYHLRSKNIRTRNPGKYHIDYIKSLQRLSTVYFEMGKF